MRGKRIVGALGLAVACVFGVPGYADRPSAAGSVAIEPIEAALIAGSAFRNVVIAPDGRRAAWLEAVLGADGRPSGRLKLTVVPLGAAGEANGSLVTVDLPGKGAGSLAFSPEGRRLAFLADDGRTPERQIWIADLVTREEAGGKKRGPVAPPLRRLTSFAGQLADLRWLPDGSGFSALATEGRSAPGGPLAAHARDAGLVGARFDVQRIARFALTTGALQWASPPDLYVYEYDSSPDGLAFVATAATGEGDAEWWVAKLWRFDSGGAGGSAPEPLRSRVLHQTHLQMAMPRWSPDGKSIAWIEGLMSDEGSIGGDVWAMSAIGEGTPGADAKNVTPGLASSPAWLGWAGPDRLLWLENVLGSTGISTLDLSTGRIERLWHGAEVLSASGGPSGLALAADGKTTAAIRHSFQHPPEIWAGEIGAWRQITNRHSAIRPLWGEAQDLRWTSDGLPIQGWLLPPAHPAQGKRQALAVLVHGGPSAAHRPGWPAVAAVLAEAGFYVLLPNPRGSFGSGSAFQAANVKDFGYGDLRDIERGIDAAVAGAPRDAPIDPARVGILGWSYGGFMAMWAVGRSDRFAAAVAGAGIANWQSYAGQNRIDEWLVPFFGATIEDDPWIYARSSPINFVTHVKAPTLVLHGERDAEVPAPQGYEFWKALRRRGVPTELYIFPDQGHSLNPESEHQRNERTVAWFRRWLPEPPETLAVVRKSDAAVDLLDPSTGRSRATLPTGDGPHEAAISPDGTTLVVSDYGTRTAPGASLTVIDLPSRRVVSTLDLGAHPKPHGLAWLGADRLAVTAEGSGELLIVEPRAAKVLAAIATGQEISHMVAVTPEGNRAFVANIGSGSVTAIDLATGMKERDIPTGAGAEGIAFRPGTREIWVTNREADTLSVIDADRLAVIATFPCPGFPIRIAFSPDGKRALVTAAKSGEVVAIDPAARRETVRKKLDLRVVAEAKDRLFGDRFAGSPAPVGLLFAPSGRRAYVAATQSDQVIEIDVESLDVVRVIETGREPDGMAVR